MRGERHDLLPAARRQNVPAVPRSNLRSCNSGPRPHTPEAGAHRHASVPTGLAAPETSSNLISLAFRWLACATLPKHSLRPPFHSPRYVATKFLPYQSMSHGGRRQQQSTTRPLSAVSQVADTDGSPRLDAGSTSTTDGEGLPPAQKKARRAALTRSACVRCRSAKAKVCSIVSALVDHRSTYAVAAAMPRRRNASPREFVIHSPRASLMVIAVRWQAASLRPLLVCQP